LKFLEYFQKSKINKKIVESDYPNLKIKAKKVLAEINIEIEVDYIFNEYILKYKNQKTM